MDYMDYNQVALERMVAYMHLDKVMVHHLKRKYHRKRNIFFKYHSYQVLLVVVDHQLMELMVVGLVDMVDMVD
jgi:hypothetical protein